MHCMDYGYSDKTRPCPSKRSFYFIGLGPVDVLPPIDVLQECQRFFVHERHLEPSNGVPVMRDG